MPLYTYRCPSHGDFTVTLKVKEVTQTQACPECEVQSARNYRADMPGPPIYYADGFHTTDYNKHGDKMEQYLDNYEKYTGEKAPPASGDLTMSELKNH